MQRSRVVVLAMVTLVLCLVLGTRLVWLQAIDTLRYQQLADQNRLFTQFDTAPRGRILDRNGTVLAQDDFRHDVVYSLRELEEVRWLAKRLARILQKSGDDSTTPFSEEHLYQALERLRELTRDRLGTEPPPPLEPLIHQLAKPVARRLEKAVGQFPGSYPGLVVEWTSPEAASVWIAPDELFAGEAAVRRLERLLQTSGQALRSGALYERVAARYRAMQDPAFRVVVAGKEQQLVDRIKSLEEKLSASQPSEDATAAERREALQQRLKRLVTQLENLRNDPSAIHRLRQEWYESEELLTRDVPFAVVRELSYFPERYHGLKINERRMRTNLAGEALAALIGEVSEPQPGDIDTWIERGEPIVDSWIKEHGELRKLRDARAFDAVQDSAHHSNEAVGRTGIERVYDDRLRGRPGALGLELDVRSRPYGPELWKLPPVPGREIRLTLDLELCRHIYATLAQLDPYGASVLIGDPNTGALIGWGSYPSFDPELRFQNSAAYEAYNDAKPGGRRLNRPLCQVAPGSVFKLVVGLGAIQDGIIARGDRFTCVGVHDPERPDILRCRNHLGHMPLEMEISEALARSCNCFFYNLGGSRMGLERMRYWAGRFGFWAPLPGLPRRPVLKETTWHDAVPAMVAIGENFTTTAIDLFRLVCGIATRGKFALPHVVADAELARADYELELRAEAWNAVRSGMVAAVSYGTASDEQIGLCHYDIAVKTGTAETSWRATPRAALSKANHAWLVGFAPVEEPQLAIVICIERSPYHGGEAAGPVAVNLLEYLESHHGYRLRR
ncbi:MAG: penicillin-binding transpeptidase domain-containing protein [Planctomycetota bacterium]